MKNRMPDVYHAKCGKEHPINEECPTGDMVNHPVHYGGKDDPHETIKCIEAWGLGYALGNAVKYISRAGKKGAEAASVDDLLKATWYVMHDVRHRHNYPHDEFKARLHKMVDDI